LMYKRHDLDDQMEIAEINTLLTLEEEAMMVGGAKRDQQEKGRSPYTFIDHIPEAKSQNRHKYFQTTTINR